MCRRRNKDASKPASKQEKPRQSTSLSIFADVYMYQSLSQTYGARHFSYNSGAKPQTVHLCVVWRHLLGRIWEAPGSKKTPKEKAGESSATLVFNQVLGSAAIVLKQTHRTFYQRCKNANSVATVRGTSTNKGYQLLGQIVYGGCTSLVFIHSK